MPRYLYVNKQRRSLVASATNSSGASLLPFVKGDKETLVLQILSERQSLSTPFDVLQLPDVRVQIGICGGTGTPTGTIHDPTNLIEAWLTWSPSLSAFTGVLDLSASTFAAFIGTSTGKPSTFEVEMHDPNAGEKLTILQKPCFCSGEVLSGA